MTSPATVTVWLLADQLLDSHPALDAALHNHVPAEVNVLFIEATQRRHKHPYQRKKLVLLLSAMRHYAAALAQRGHPVDYRIAPTFADGLQQHTAEFRPAALFCMAAADYPGRLFQRYNLSALLGIPVTVLSNTQFLTGQVHPLADTPRDKTVIMETFYRTMRRELDVLMTPAGDPEGGQWNFDAENRKPLPRHGYTPPAPPLTFDPDETTQSVITQLDAEAHGVGQAAGFNLAVTHTQARAALADFITHRLPYFGDYEDAMSAEHATLYHSVLSPYLNIGLLTPTECVTAAEQAYHSGHAPLNAVEGFIRQLIGWREYIYWQYWRQMPALAEVNHWGFTRPLPAFFWDANTDLNCLRHVIQRALTTGYTHHIERLMIVCNYAMLAGLSPQAVNDWFLSLYIDAYEWVMLPNVLGMGLNADGGRTATKPYIASANYINKMSDYCTTCRYDPKQRTGPTACPFNTLYWNFLIEHETALRANPRSGKNVLGLRHLDPAQRLAVSQQAADYLATLTPGD